MIQLAPLNPPLNVVLTGGSSDDKSRAVAVAWSGNDTHWPNDLNLRYLVVTPGPDAPILASPNDLAFLE